MESEPLLSFSNSQCLGAPESRAFAWRRLQAREAWLWLVVKAFADTFFTLADGESAREPGLRFGGDSGLERLASNWWPRRSLIHLRFARSYCEGDSSVSLMWHAAEGLHQVELTAVEHYNASDQGS